VAVSTAAEPVRASPVTAGVGTGGEIRLTYAQLTTLIDATVEEIMKGLKA
jgi:hypothetical protein